MTKSSFKRRPAWTDRFHEPTVRALQAGLSDEHREVFIAARSGFRGLADVCETVEWAGIPMRWSFVYRIEGHERALAYLVPDPSKPALVLPLTEHDIDAVLTKRLPKFVHEGILHAAEVAKVRWAQWPLTSLPQVKELARLTPRKLAALTA